MSNFSEKTPSTQGGNTRQREIVPGLFTSIMTPKFLTLQPTSEKGLPDDDEVIVSELLANTTLKFENLTKTRSNTILIKVTDEKTIDSVTKLKSINSFPVKVTPHPRLNQELITIHAPELTEYSLDQLQSNWVKQGLPVERVARLKCRGHIDQNTSPRILITFSESVNQEHMRHGFQRYKTKLFIPAPNRCFVCQKLGHRSKFCKSEPICHVCGQSKHVEQGERCNNPPFCVNCKASHDASYRSCPAYLEAKEIITIQTKQKCTRKEAKQQLPQGAWRTFPRPVKDGETPSNPLAQTVGVTQNSSPPRKRWRPSQQEKSLSQQEVSNRSSARKNYTHKSQSHLSPPKRYTTPRTLNEHKVPDYVYNWGASTSTKDKQPQNVDEIAFKKLSLVEDEEEQIDMDTSQEPGKKEQRNLSLIKDYPMPPTVIDPAEQKTKIKILEKRETLSKKPNAELELSMSKTNQKKPTDKQVNLEERIPTDTIRVVEHLDPQPIQTLITTNNEEILISPNRDPRLNKSKR